MDERREINSLLTQARHWESAETIDFGGLVRLRQSLVPLVRATRYRRELNLDASEALRRTERATGLMLRRAQGAGLLRDKGGIRTDLDAPRPHEVMGYAESGALTPAYLFADAPAEVFEQALQACREAGLLGQSRMERVVRELTGNQRPSDAVSLSDRRANRIQYLADANHTSRQIAADLKVRVHVVADLARRYGIDIPADAVVGPKTRRINSAKIISQTIDALEGLVSGLDLVDDYDSLDPRDADDWAASLSKSLSALFALRKELNRVSNC